MPRTARNIASGVIYHVLNRGNARQQVFFDAHDYQHFATLMLTATQRHPGELIAACLMPNHFHFVMRPTSDGGLAAWMHWIGTTHAAHHHDRYGTSGHIWQGRFKAFPVQEDGHLLTVLRYVERNAARAGLVAAAEDWPWGSLCWRDKALGRALLCAPPIDLPDDWARQVNTPHSNDELRVIRNCVQRGAPFGDPRWRQACARRLGIEFTLRGPGRPRKARSTQGTD